MDIEEQGMVPSRAAKTETGDLRQNQCQPGQLLVLAGGPGVGLGACQMLSREHSDPSHCCTLTTHTIA